MEFEQTLSYFSRLFLVSESDSFIIDFKLLNIFVIKAKFKMETVCVVKISLQKLDLSTSADMRDAFLHVMLNIKSRHLVRFKIGTETSSFKFCFSD